MFQTIHILKSINIKCYSTLLSFVICVGITNGQNVTGAVTDTVYCDANRNHSYCLYLPSSYSPEKKLPVVFIHDPAARAKLAVEVFKHAAEKHNYILACSYNIQNGTDGDALISASQIMMQDVLEKFYVDKARIYLAGFSGGSRLATAVALQQQNIAGVIAVGAGLPRQFQADEFNKNMIYAVVSGTLDMNYIEQYNLRTMLELNSVSARFFEFAGGHTWCDSLTCENIFQWLDYRAMQDGLTPNDTAFCNNFLRSSITETLSYISKDDPFRAQIAATDLSEDSQDSLQYLNSAFDTLELYLHKKETEKKLTHILQVLSEEETEKENYIIYIQYRMPGALIYDSSKLKKDIWWKTTSVKLRKLQSSQDTYEAESSSRLYDFLFRNVWEQGDIYYTAAQYTYAREMYYLLTLLDTESKFAYYQLARAEAKTDDVHAALRALEASVKNGFVHISLLEKDEAFSAMKNNKKFIKLIEELKAAQNIP